MAKELEDDERIAHLCECSVQTVAETRRMWEKNLVMRAVLAFAIDRQLDERRTQLETAFPECVKNIQGEIRGLRAAKAIVLKTEK